MFSAFENDGFGIYVLQPSTLAPSPSPAILADGSAARLPPVERRNDGRVIALLDNATLGLPFDWGVAAQQAPYCTGAFAAGLIELDGRTVFAERVLLDRQIDRRVDFTLAYPFSRVQRVELSAGYRNIGFDRELRTVAFSLETGQLLLDETEDLPTPSALNLATGSAALVYDNAIIGAVGPILGQRYRFEASPAFGSLDIVSTVADFRRYFIPVRPLTFAVRVLHFARYGPDADDERLSPLFLGWDGIVRGYSFGSNEPNECDPPPDQPTACPVFDRLLGSRLLVGNAELRFPLLGVLGVGSGYYGAFPLEMAVFGDAGVAWTGDVDPTFFSGTRKPVYSAGVALRANIFGVLVAQLDLVHPFDRPERNWVWQFSFLPAF